jgi:pantoate--beta-alanine ligase
VLLPSAEEMYADGFRYRVSETQLSTTLEGIHRPGHFDGVLTVVLKLLNIAAAERAYFGEKDWQQLSLVRGMADAFFLPTTIVGAPRFANRLDWRSVHAMRVSAHPIVRVPQSCIVS